MPTSLQRVLTTIESMDEKNASDAALLRDFQGWMADNQKSEAYIKNNLKAIINFTQWRHERYPDETLHDVKDDKVIRKFLDSKRDKTNASERWHTTWNDYLDRIKVFYRWLYNIRLKDPTDQVPMEQWTTPAFMKIHRQKITHQTYSAAETWEFNELLSILKYEQDPRSKAAITLAWDINARNQDIVNIKNKNIRFKAQYAEGEIPKGKTGSRPIVLAYSYPYVREWYNIHPLKNEPNAYFICEARTGRGIKSDQVRYMMNHLKDTIKTLLEREEIKDPEERARLENLLKTKKWNPYCLRHSSITADADLLPEFVLRKKAGWTINSKQPGRYAKNRWGTETQNVILKSKGLIVEELEGKPVHRICSRCRLVNPLEFEICGDPKCGYPLSMEAFDTLKAKELEKDQMLQEIRTAQQTQANEIQFMKTWMQNKNTSARKELDPDADYALMDAFLKYMRFSNDPKVTDAQRKDREFIRSYLQGLE